MRTVALTILRRLEELKLEGRRFADTMAFSISLGRRSILEVMAHAWHLFGPEPVIYCKAGIGTLIGRIQLGAGEGPGKTNGEDLGGGGREDKGKNKNRSRFPAGMTNIKASAKAKAEARTEADSLTLPSECVPHMLWG